jgi:HD-GYP domain-containing protein (c-di-GMP phosphodiesterase class II)
MSSTFHPIDPRLVAKMAADEQPKVDIADYFEAICTLRKKDFSFADIASWLNEKLGTSFDRNQVYQAFKTVGQPPAPETAPLVDDETGEVVEP